MGPYLIGVFQNAYIRPALLPNTALVRRSARHGSHALTPRPTAHAASTPAPSLRSRQGPPLTLLHRQSLTHRPTVRSTPTPAPSLHSRQGPPPPLPYPQSLTHRPTVRAALRLPFRRFLPDKHSPPFLIASRKPSAPRLGDTWQAPSAFDQLPPDAHGVHSRLGQSKTLAPPPAIAPSLAYLKAGSSTPPFMLPLAPATNTIFHRAPQRARFDRDIAHEEDGPQGCTLPEIRRDPSALQAPHAYLQFRLATPTSKLVCPPSNAFQSTFQRASHPSAARTGKPSRWRWRCRGRKLQAKAHGSCVPPRAPPRTKSKPFPRREQSERVRKADATWKVLKLLLQVPEEEKESTVELGASLFPQMFVAARARRARAMPALNSLASADARVRARTDLGRYGASELFARVPGFETRDIERSCRSPEMNASWLFGVSSSTYVPYIHQRALQVEYEPDGTQRGQKVRTSSSLAPIPYYHTPSHYPFPLKPATRKSDSV
ncbi:hypothetical protein DFH06DRAFT_1319874 [Mycena polygramma]|nr:hypothetical protein DFH06DRAFT_1319874 [Mycena polygramma]